MGANSSLPIELKLLSSILCVLVTQACPTLCNSLDSSPPGSSVHGILQARIVPFPFPGDRPDPGIEPGLPHWQADSLPSEPPGGPNRGHFF